LTLKIITPPLPIGEFGLMTYLGYVAVVHRGNSSTINASVNLPAMEKSVKKMKVVAMVIV